MGMGRDPLAGLLPGDLVRHWETREIGTVIRFVYANPLVGWRYYDVHFRDGIQIVPSIDLELISRVVQN
jgi:hypothetical protein